VCQRALEGFPRDRELDRAGLVAGHDDREELGARREHDRGDVLAVGVDAHSDPLDFCGVIHTLF
jgi:hypothetical protein